MTAVARWTSMPGAGPSRRRAVIPTASMGLMLPTAASPSTPETAIPSPPPAITPTASWATISAPENPGPWISRSGAASKPAARARTASGWASSTTWEKWSEPPGWAPTATAGKLSGWTAGYTAARARRRASFWRAAAGSTLGQQERSVPIPASPFAPQAAATPNSSSTWISTAAKWPRSLVTTTSSTTAARPPSWSTR